MSPPEEINVFIDGGARGNPGPAALGVVIQDKNKNLIKEYKEYLGITSNNQAEYQALIFALKKIKKLFGRKKIKTMRVNLFSDSQLLVKQLNGQFKILDPVIQKLFIKAWNLKTEFPYLRISYIPRRKNKRADFLVNQTLNISQSSLL